jgi:hypothetical protein
MRSIWNRLFDLTGFRGKTLWDFLGLLIVPVVIALAGWYLSEVSTRNQQQIEDQRSQAQQETENDRVRQSVLQSYIQHMTELLLDKGLATSKPEQPIRQISRSSTLATIRQLDADRKAILLQFLYESNLIKEIDPIINLRGADLRDANLLEIDLRDANLNHADLSDANLSGADHRGAKLSDANLSGTILSSVNLRGANLRGTYLVGADLSGADLSLADLSGADLHGAYLFGTNLGNTNLSGADLSNTALVCSGDGSYCSFSGGANLSQSKNWTNEQLAQAKSLIEATLPNGTVMTEEMWEEFKTRYGQ